IYCFLTINIKIKRVTFGRNLRKKHGKALRVLTLQALNPFVFIYFPLVLIFVACLYTEHWHFTEKIADILIHFYPISNAIIILTMTDEYSNTILRR
ncbi:hypothetical protein PMAYCL1PPCAC_13664, partial [Pristionchus mayeri]